MLEFLKTNNLTEAGWLFAMFIIWSLWQQIMRHQGLKKYKEVTNGNPHPKCRMDDNWKQQVRDNTRDIRSNQDGILKNLVKIKEMMIKHYGVDGD